MRYYWRKTGTQMVLYEEDAARTLGIALSIRMAEYPADPPEANYVAEGPLIGGPYGYRTLHEAMEAGESALRQAGESVTTSYKDFRYRPL